MTTQEHTELPELDAAVPVDTTEGRAGQMGSSKGYTQRDTDNRRSANPVRSVGGRNESFERERHH